MEEMFSTEISEDFVSMEDRRQENVLFLNSGKIKELFAEMHQYYSRIYEVKKVNHVIIAH